MLSTILFLTSGCLNTWFWFKGLDAVNPHQCMTPRGFFLANLSAYGHGRTLFKIFSLAFIIILTPLFGVGLILGARSVQSVENTGDDQENIELEAMTAFDDNGIIRLRDRNWKRQKDRVINRRIETPVKFRTVSFCSELQRGFVYVKKMAT
jgi:hypothetical protein